MKEIYLDNAATTPLDGRVLEAMLPYLENNFGNPDSRYGLGRSAAAALRLARDGISDLIKGSEGNVYFTSCGSEANSWALKGICAANFGKKDTIILSATEHPSLLRAAQDMSVFGFRTVLVKPDSYGIVHAQSVKDALRANNAAFVGVMSVNNETGVIQPCREIYEACREAGVFYFCDCVQAAPSLPLDCSSADGISISAHKFRGPKGAGALWLRKGVRIERLVSGGQQESGLRGGTSNVAGAVGMFRALELAQSGLERYEREVRLLRDRFLKLVTENVEGAFLVGHPEKRIASNANICFSGCRGEQIMINLDMQGVAASTGSACSSGASKPSPVLLAMGMDERTAASCVRFTFGSDNTMDDVVFAAEAVKKAVQAVKN